MSYQVKEIFYTLGKAKAPMRVAPLCSAALPAATCGPDASTPIAPVQSASFAILTL